MADVLAVAVVDPLDEAGRRRAEELLSRLASEYAGRVELSSKVRGSIVSSLSEAEIIGAESRRYSGVVVLVASRRTARLVYDLGVAAERPLVLLVAEGSGALAEALEAYGALRRQGVPVTRPSRYPGGVLSGYMDAISMLSRMFGASLLLIGGVPSWVASGPPPGSELRRLLDAMILQLDLNDVVSRFEELYEAGEAERLARLLEARGVRLGAPLDELRGALTLALVLEKLAVDNTAVGIALNCREVEARLGDPGYLSASLLLENDSVPVACDADLVAVATAALVAGASRLLIATPVEETGEGVVLEAYAAPPSSLEAARVEKIPGVGVVVAGRPRAAGEVWVARLDAHRRVLHLCGCPVASASDAPLPSLTLADCSCLYEAPGRYYPVILDREGVERLVLVAELLGVEVARHRATDTN